MTSIYINAGSLTRQVTFQRRTETLAASGAVTETWSNLYTVRAEVRAPVAVEVAMGFGQAEHESIVVMVRWNPSPVTVGDRVLYEGRTFDIRQIAEIGRRVGFKIAAVAA